MGLEGLNPQQRTFVMELLASDTFDIAEAARTAGYANPSQRGNKLLTNPIIQKALGKAQREREERCKLKADDVLNYLEKALFFNPTHYFLPADDGKSWLIKDLSELPEEYGRLIDGVEIKTITTKDGDEITYHKIKLIPKSVVLPLAMKHLGLMDQKVHIDQKITINWEDMTPDHDSKVPDAIEERILEVENRVIEHHVEDE